MRVCAVSFKECWQDADGNWYSTGGFPLQMAAVGSLFDRMTLLVTRQENVGAGGIPLPPGADVVILRRPPGENFRRKLYVVAHLFEYLSSIVRHARQADVIHVPPPGDIPLLGMIVALVMRKRQIVRYCGSWLPTAHTTMMNRVTRSLMRLFAGGRNVMLATGIGASPPAPRMNWIFATATTEQEVATVRPNLDRPGGGPLRLIYLGRLSYVKGVAILVEALHRLSRQAPEVLGKLELVIAGDGGERESLEKAVRKYGLSERVRFVGQLDRPSLIEMLSRADICVLPSLSESFCKARLEAMLCGTPVLTTEVGFGEELVGRDGERGWVVTSGDATHLAETLKRLVDEPIDFPALRKRCRQFAESRTLEAWVREIGRLCCEQWNVRLVGGRLVD